MSSEEEDYMSDTFLLNCVDTRPGLGTKRTQQQAERDRKQKDADTKSRTIPHKKLEASRREEGLNSSITPNSKGFALLQKMGYKPGTGIGKEGTGRVEPVSIELKSGRGGLGRESELKRRAQEANQMRAAMQAKRLKAEEKIRKNFKEHVSQRFSGKNVERDLRTAQRACHHLDVEKGLTEPEEAFFWPASSPPSAKEEEELQDDEEQEERRKKRWFQESDRHDDSDVDNDDSENEVEETPAWLEFSEFERLDILTRYLRNVYFYCIWCGTKYDGQEDMLSNCPGNTQEAHD